jgi:N12 class adenine-specific DNA methylase/adenine-specific DNA methylase
MATKLQFYQGVAERTLGEITAYGENWRRFLDTAARLYKYPFYDQLMIHAQRPDATACAELEFWNEKFNRWVRRGAKGIALIDDSGSYPKLKYVFDVSDTEASLYRARPVQLWEMTQEHKAPVLAELAKNYEDIDPDGTLADAFRSIAKQLASEYYEDNAREIGFRAENSALEPYAVYDNDGSPYDERDETALRVAFEEALSASIAYSVMARCGLDTSEYFGEEDFQRVIDFNTPDMVHALGVAAADLSGQVLRDVEITIRRYERIKAAQLARNSERSEQDYDKNPYLQPSGRLSAPGHPIERTATVGNSAVGTLRTNEESVPQRPQEDNVQQAPVVGETVPAPERGGRSSEPEIRADNGRADGADEPAGQSGRPDEVDGGDEHAESASGGSHPERTDLQVNENETPSEPGGVVVSADSQQRTLSQLGKSSIEELLSTSPVSMDEVDSILRDGGNFDNHFLSAMPWSSRSSLRIAAHFAKGLGDNAEYLKREYLTGRYGRGFTESGKGFDFSPHRAGSAGAPVGNHKVCAWYDAHGISLAIGTTAQNNIHRVTIPWESAAARIDELMREGRYVSREAFDSALDNERLELADRIWNFYRDGMGGIPDEWRGESFGHPEDIAKIKSMLDVENERQAIRDRVEADVAAWRNDPERRRVWQDPSRLLGEMNDAMYPPVMFPRDDFTYKRNFAYFITQDEIDALITHGGIYGEGKFRFLSFFLGDHDEKEKLDFVKREYGHGGGTWSQTDGWYNAEPGKGLLLQRGSISKPDAEVNFKWNAVSKRTEQLIGEGRYMTRDELDAVHNYERLMLMRRLQSFYYDLPETIKIGDTPNPGDRPFDGLDFQYPHEAEWEAMRGLLNDPERVDALLAAMKPIYDNTIPEDRYYNSRKAAFENLNAYRDGTYTLFPGLENLPDPDAVITTRGGGTRRETIIDLSDSPSGNAFSFTPTNAVQMSLFDDSPLPILPSVEEQRAKINETLKDEAEKTEARADAPFLNISDTDKARIAAQFTVAPRSREAANLVKEVYGDTLGTPLPQAIKRISGLVAEGKYTVATPELTEAQKRRQAILAEVDAIKAENGGAMVAYQVGEFYEMYGEDARIAADALGISLITLRDLTEPTVMVGFPTRSLGDSARTLGEAGHALAVLWEHEDGRKTVSIYPAKETEQSPADNRRAYEAGDTVWFDGRKFVIDRISDYYKQPDELDRRFATFGYRVELTDITGGYPIGRSMYSAEVDYKLEMDERNAQLLPLGGGESPVKAETAPEESLNTKAEREATLDAQEPGEADYAAADLDKANGDLIDVLEHGFIPDSAKAEIVKMFADGADNAALAAYLSESCQDRAEIITLETGEEADCLSNRFGLFIDIDDKHLTKLGFTWEEITPVLRALAARGSERDRFAVAAMSADAGDSLADLIRRELDGRGFAVSDELIADGISDYNARGGGGDFQDIADFIENEYLTDAHIIPIDFEAVAQTALRRVIADPDYAEALAEANSRAALRNPCTWALEQSIRDHEQDEPDIYAAYFGDADFNDNLFDYVLKTSWERRLELLGQDTQISDAPAEQTTEPQFTEIADPEILAEAKAIFGGDAPRTPYIQGSRIVLDLRGRFEGSGVPDPAILTGEFVIESVDGGNVTISTSYSRDGDNPGSPRSPQTSWGGNTYSRWNGGSNNAKYSATLTAAEVESLTVQPVAEKIYEETAANGRTDYYLFRYPDGVDAGANLSHDTLSLITEKADGYVICAEACHISDEEMREWNIGFRKMPRDWNLLPETVQDQIRRAAPIYEQKWNGMYGERDITPESPTPTPPASATPRYEVGPITVVEAISSNPSYAGLLERGDGSRRYGIFDNEIGQYLSDPESAEATLMFLTEAEAQAYIDRLTKQERLAQGVNFRITDDHLGEGGAKTKFRNNILALQTLKTLERENRAATPEEQETLSRYIGWGGLPQAFDPDNKDWAREYAVLNAVLTPEEFDSARASTLNAHYTSPVVVKAMWEAIGRMGFEKGNVLEPSMGIGNFFGLIPDAMKQSKLYGVELDSVTARIAQKLYPNANIQQTGFERTDFSDAFFDLAIGNVPFGSYGVIDKRYEKHDFSIHNYFFAKALDKVRPGGVVAFITSKFTMDERNPSVRKYIAERAELLGAVRLPNNAFLKNAGTETTMDILFLQKRDRPLDIEPDWVHLGLTDDEIPVNRYFLDNPEMVLGVMGLDERMNSKYGRNDMTACLSIDGADLAQQLSDALANIEGEYSVTELDDLEGVDNHAIPADPSVKNFSYAAVDDTVYFRENSLMYPVDLPQATLDRIKGMIGLRASVQKLIDLQLDDYTTDDEIKHQQEQLSDLYDSFVAEYGLINSATNNRAFNADSAYYLLSSLEILNEDGELERKADMFTKRTIKQKSVVTHVDTASEALAVSLGEKARVDLDYMSDLTGKDKETLFAELRGVIFKTTKGDYETADEFLSGDVREKLRRYKMFADDTFIDDNLRQAYRDNIEALTAVQPKDLEAGEISVRLGATWIDPQYVQQFMYELFNTSYYNQRVYQALYHKVTGEWQVTGKGKSQFSDVASTMTYGTGRMNAYQILEDTLNLRDVRVYDRKEDADGKERRVLNKKETMLAQQKQEMIKQAFKDWIWKDPERRQTLVALYNEKFNSVRPREYDGSHITFSGISQDIELRPHQLNAIAHILYGGNTLLAHEVGAGKTFEMVAAAMEAKRLGQCHKSLFAVPNHLTEQWAAEFLRLYPSANILVATKRDFEMRNRKKFCAKIATGDYDAVIIGHSQLEKIPMSHERQERQIREQIWEIEEGIRELKAANGDRTSIKQFEKTKRSLNNRLTKLLESKKRDDVVTFEQLGCDRLYIDEAHNFKNLFMYTKMRNVAGLSTSEAQKSSDLFMKCRYLDELTGNKGVIFATGTPISNSMTEMFTMQRYLQHDRLNELGLLHFDSWASIFGETQTSIELAPEGNGYRARTRFAKFHNLPELMCTFKEVADIQTADMLNLPVPEAKYETVVVEPSDLQKDMVEELSERAAAVHNRMVDPQTDNMLKITTDGRKIGLDQRLMNPLLPDFEGSKVNACTDKVYEIWQDTSKDRLTQLVFCDFSTPNKDGRFNVYDDIKAKLIARGIPGYEIAFIHDADTETKKKELFAKVRQGKIRILFGSTFKMGAGTNVQDRLIAIHDADCPWRPADLAQRAGRIVRQGNRNSEVQIFRYATSGTFDSYLWQTVQKKQEFIAQIMSSKSPVRSCDDVDETALSYAEIKALCAGNPLIAEKMALDNDVAKLRMLKSEYKSQHYRLEDSLIKHFPQQIKAVTERIAGIEKDIAHYAAEKEKYTEVTMTNGAASVTTKFPEMTINGVTHTEKEPAAKALLEACKGIKGRETELPVGEFMGFKLSLSYASFGQTINLMMRGAMTYQTELGTDAFGNITRITNALDKLPERLQGAREQLANYEKQVAAAKEELAKPFSLEDELQAKEARLALLNADLNIDGDGDMDILNDPDNRDENAASNDETDNGRDDADDERDDADEEVCEFEPEQSGSPFELTNPDQIMTYGCDAERAAHESVRTGTYGKSAPGILDDIRAIKGEMKPSALGGAGPSCANKAAEIDI